MVTARALTAALVLSAATAVGCSAVSPAEESTVGARGSASACAEARAYREQARAVQSAPLDDPRFSSSTDQPRDVRRRGLRRSGQMQRLYALAYEADQRCTSRG